MGRGTSTTQEVGSRTALLSQKFCTPGVEAYAAHRAYLYSLDSYFIRLA